MSSTRNSDSPMKSLFFFDDWLLHAREGLDRMQGRPEHLKQLELETSPDPQVKTIRGDKIHYDQSLDRYFMYIECIDRQDKRCKVRVETDDPCNWPKVQITPGDGPLWTRIENVVLDQHNQPVDCFNVFPLVGTPLAERGNVVTFFDYGETHRGIGPNREAPSAAIAFSKDGVHFDVEEGNNWISHHSDTANLPFYNPFTEQYGITCRTEQSDRRVALVTTTDFKTFSSAQIILQPDADDPVGREFYGMDVHLYDDMFVGTVFIYDTESTEKAFCKMQGTNQMQLAYSYDGGCWNRASREMFMPRTDPGTPRGGSVYAATPVYTPDQRLLFYVTACWGDHAAYHDISDELMYQFFTSHLYQMRKDGFAYLRTRARHGRIRTKCVVLQGGEMTANMRTTPTGCVKVELLDAATYEPIPNYTLEDAVPLSGDELSGTIRWRERANLDELKGKHVIVDVHVREGSLYAMRFGYGVHLGEYAHNRV